MVTWMRTNKVAAAILTVLRVFIGYNWMIHGIEKLTEGFSASGFLGKIVESPVVGTTGDPVYPWFNAFISGIALPNAGFFNVMIPIGELLIGIALITGTLTTLSAFVALVMNWSFVLGGSISENPTYIFIEYLLLFGGLNAGIFGVDRWLIPWMRANIFARFKKDKGQNSDGGSPANSVATE